MNHVVVLGGGISGLAAAWEFVHPTGGVQPCAVTLVEAGPRLGGKIRSRELAGKDVESGPDAFVARVPAAARLAAEVGLAEDLVPPATGRAWMWVRGRLRPLPTGLVLGVPSDLCALARSGVVPPQTTARAALDLVLPGRPVESEDVSVGELVRRRMGTGLQLGLVDPLLGGINAGHTDRLSAAVAAPQLLGAARRDRSLILALRGVLPPDGRGPVFLTVRGGLERLVAAVAERVARVPGSAVELGDAAVALAWDGGAPARLPARGDKASAGTRAASVGSSVPGSAAGSAASARVGWAVRLASGRALTADAVVMACPAADAASLLASVSPDAAAGLRSIEMTSVAMTLLAYPAAAVGVPLAGSGFLVPRGEGRLLTAASWVGAKWPHLAIPGTVVVRASAGRTDDGRADELNDAELIDAVHGELALAMGLRTPPLAAVVQRWPAAFPQFDVGHLARIARIEQRLALDAPGIVLAGAMLRGVGIATCIAGGRDAATRARMAL